MGFSGRLPLTEATFARISMQVELGVVKRAIGRSRGGATTKIHLAVYAHGHPINLEITGGEVHDSQVASDLIELVGEADYLIADKGYDSEHIREIARNHRMTPIIPRKSQQKAKHRF